MGNILDPNSQQSGKLGRLQYVSKYENAARRATLSRQFGQWAAKPGVYVPVPYSTIGKGLGLPNNNGYSYISASDVATLTLMRHDGALTDQQKNAFDTLFTTLGQSGKSGNAYKDWQGQGSFLHMRDVINNAMGDVASKVGVTGIPTTTPETIDNYVQSYPYKSTASGGAIMKDWTYSQNRQYDTIDSFMQYWPTFDKPAVQNEITKAINSGWTAKQIESALYDPKAVSGPLANTVKAFQQDFPALVTAHQTGKAINTQTPAQYQQAATDFQTVMQRYGMPNLSSADIAQLLANNVDPQTLAQRAQLATEAYQTAPADVRQMLEKRWGLTPGQGAHYILDPTNGYERIKDQMASATMQSRGTPAGVTQQQTDKLASLVDNPFSGVSQDQANKALDQANALQGLQQQSYGMQGQTTAGSEDVLGAAIGGYGQNQLGAQQKVEQAQQERAQASKAGGQMLTDQTGVKGAALAQ